MLFQPAQRFDLAEIQSRLKTGYVTSRHNAFMVGGVHAGVRAAFAAAAIQQIGPWVTTADEITDPHSLGIHAFVNGENRQDSNIGHLVFDIWDQIAQLSQAMTLEPGDLIFTGTPGGVGLAMTPRQFLKAGDIVRCEIDRLGAIEATLVMEP